MNPAGERQYVLMTYQVTGSAISSFLEAPPVKRHNWDNYQSVISMTNEQIQNHYER